MSPRSNSLARHVDALAEDLHREHAPQAANIQVTQPLVTEIGGIVAGERDAAQTRLRELAISLSYLRTGPQRARTTAQSPVCRWGSLFMENIEHAVERFQAWVSNYVWNDPYLAPRSIPASISSGARSTTFPIPPGTPAVERNGRDSYSPAGQSWDIAEGATASPCKFRSELGELAPDERAPMDSLEQPEARPDAIKGPVLNQPGTASSDPRHSDRRQTRSSRLCLLRTMAEPGRLR
jgi:hypothetical protein